MTTLADIRTKVRKDLRDTDSGNYRWTDAQLDRHIEHALSDLSLAIPLEQSDTVATTEGSREISVASFTGLMEVEAVEYPLAQFPPCYPRFSVWETTLTLLAPTVPAGDDAKVFYTARHVVDGSGSTVPAALEDALAMGAAGYAAIEYGGSMLNSVTTHASTPNDYSAWGQAWLTAFRQLLAAQSRANRIRSHRMYVPA